MRPSTYCLLALAAVLALAPAAAAQFGNRPNDMHIYQNGYPSPGSQVGLTFAVTTSPGPNLGYQAAVSQGWQGGVPLPGGKVPLTPDPFFFATAQNLLPQIFAGFGGKLDAQGTAQGSITVPPIPALDGAVLYMAFVVYDAQGIRGISRAHKFQILDRPQTAACGNTPSTGIEVVDLDGKSILKSIQLGSAPFAQAPFYDLSLKNLLVAEWGGLFHRIDSRTLSPLTSFQFSIGVNNMVGGTTAMTSRGESAFVCNANPATPSVVEVDLATFKEVNNYAFPIAMGRCAGIAVRPFSTEALVTCFLTNGALYKFDLENGAINTVAAMNSVDNPQDAVWRPQSDYVFVAQNGGTASTFTPAVLAYDAAKGYQLARIIPVGTMMPGPAGISMSSDGTYFYADSMGNNTATKIDSDPASPGFLSVIKTIPYPVGWTSGGWMIRNYDGSKAYVLLSTGLGELDTATDTFSPTVVPTTSGAAIMSARQRQDT